MVPLVELADRFQDGVSARERGSAGQGRASHDDQAGR
jgi:hypothetical protein